MMTYENITAIINDLSDEEFDVVLELGSEWLWHKKLTCYSACETILKAHGLSMAEFEIWFWND